MLYLQFLREHFQVTSLLKDCCPSYWFEIWCMLLYLPFLIDQCSHFSQIQEKKCYHPAEYLVYLLIPKMLYKIWQNVFDGQLIQSFNQCIREFGLSRVKPTLFNHGITPPLVYQIHFPPMYDYVHVVLFY